MYARHGARTHFPTLQPYHNKTFLPRHVHELSGGNHQTDRAAARVRLLGTNCNICLAVQLLVLTSVVARALFWRPPSLVTYPDFYK